jgi:hypothetical protein
MMPPALGKDARQHVTKRLEAIGGFFQVADATSLTTTKLGLSIRRHSAKAGTEDKKTNPATA